MAEALRTFRWRRQKSRKTNRVIVQADQFGFGPRGAATAGGDTLRASLAADQRALFPGSAGKLKNIWCPGYDAEEEDTPDQMLLHFDDEENRIRVCSCLTQNGKPRKVGMQDKAGGRVYVTYVCADGSVKELVSEPGALLFIWVPSGGFYAMSGPGSGAAHDEHGGLQWQHGVYPCESASIVPILDHYAPVEQQPQQMAAAKAELVRRGLERARSGASWTPASLPCMRQVVDFESKEPDSMGGMGREVHFYRKCVDEGKIVHVERTFEEMHAEGSRIAGKMDLKDGTTRADHRSKIGREYSVQPTIDKMYKVEFSIDNGATYQPLETVNPRTRSDSDGGIQQWLQIPNLGRVNFKKKKGGCRDKQGHFLPTIQMDTSVAGTSVRLFATLA